MDNNSYDKLINRIIDKRYKIETVVGVGGMAYVLRAKDMTTGRDVAIKILSDEFKDDERAVKRFINESKTVSMLDHENIVKILDVVITDDLKYIVMEFIDGITLKDYIDRIGTLSWKEAVYYTKQILRALSHAHEKQVIHRDIKPQNIMLLSDGTVKVTDFGIAKHPNAEAITMTDKAIGTVNYISPEQASGAAVDFRTDIYSTGVMLYEMVTGRLPFIADSPVAVAMMQVSNEPVPPRELNPQIPVGLEQIILKAMQKNPDDRFASASAMLKALDYFTENPDVVFAGGKTSTGGSIAAGVTANYEDEQKKKARMKKYVRGSRSMFPIIAGVAAAFAAVAIVFVIVWVLPFFKGATPADSQNKNTLDALGDGFSTAVDRFLGVDGDAAQNKKVTVESFVGKKYDDALISEMSTLGFNAETVNYVRNPNFGVGEVVRQEPEAGAIRLKAENGLVPVVLYVNMGQKDFKMPDCTLLSVADAKKLLRSEYNAISASELSEDAVEIIEEYHDTYPADYVIRTTPAAGEVTEVDSTTRFKLYVSKGQKIANTTVPTLEGLTLADAKKSILNAKLALGKIYYEESAAVGAGLVMKASRTPGETVAENVTSIDLWVSIGSKDAIVTEPEPDVPDTGNTGNTGHNGNTGTTGNNGHTGSNANTGNTGTTEPNTGNTGSEPAPDSGSTGENTGSTGENTGDTGNASSDIAGLLDMRNSDD